MTKRWRDHKGEPGFVFHAWMSTVDDLEDEIERLRDLLREANHWLDGRSIVIFTEDLRNRINAALSEAGDE